MLSGSDRLAEQRAEFAEHDIQPEDMRRLGFRRSLQTGNRICLCSFMAAEYDDLPEPVKQEVLRFADVNIAWLRQLLLELGEAKAEQRASAIFAAIVGAQLIARSRADISVFDGLVEGYRMAGLLP